MVVGRRKVALPPHVLAKRKKMREEAKERERAASQKRRCAANARKSTAARKWVGRPAVLDWSVWSKVRALIDGIFYVSLNAYIGPHTVLRMTLGPEKTHSRPQLHTVISESDAQCVPHNVVGSHDVPFVDPTLVVDALASVERWRVQDGCLVATFSGATIDDRMEHLVSIAREARLQILNFIPAPAPLSSVEPEDPKEVGEVSVSEVSTPEVSVSEVSPSEVSAPEVSAPKVSAPASGLRVPIDPFTHFVLTSADLWRPATKTEAYMRVQDLVDAFEKTKAQSAVTAEWVKQRLCEIGFGVEYRVRPDYKRGGRSFLAWWVTGLRMKNTSFVAVA